MVPCQIYQAVFEQRGHELRAAARRHELVTQARRTQADRTSASFGLADPLVHLMSRLHIRRAARDTRSATTTPAAGPMGCVA